MRVRTAVLPVAGLGTRFLPATRAIPKELLPVVDRPVVHFVLQEARQAGIERFVFVTSRGKSVIEDHFDRNLTLETALEKRGEGKMIEAQLRELPAPGDIVYVRQGMPLGLGHAIACARGVVGDEAFAVLLPDDLFLAARPAIGQVIDAWKAGAGKSVVGVQEVPDSAVSSYGIVDPGESAGLGFAVKDMVEKPRPEKAPSRLAAVGRYVLEPDIFDALPKESGSLTEEIQITDAIGGLARRGRVEAVKIVGERFDCGTPLGLLKANVASALDRPELAGDFRKYLAGLDLS